MYWVESLTERRDGGAWIAGKEGRIFYLDQEGVHSWYKTHAKTELPSEITSIIEDREGRIVVSTQDDGIFVFNFDGRLLDRIHTGNGLKKDRVSHLYVDQQNGLWVSMSGVVQRFELKRKSLLYDSSLGLFGEVLCISSFQDRLYVGTDMGLFVMDDEQFPVSFRKIPNISSVNWMDVSNDHLLLISNVGFASFDGESMTSLLGEGAEFAIVSTQHPGWVFVDDGNRLKGFEWIDDELVESAELLNDHGRPLGFSEDSYGWTWAVVQAGKSFRFRPVGDAFEFETIDRSHGLPDIWAQVFTIGGECYLGCEDTKKWNEAAHRFEPTEEYGYYLGWIPFGYEHSFSIFNGENKGHWVANGRNVGTLVRRPSRDSIKAIVLDGLNFDFRSNSVFWESEEVAWIGSANSLIRFESSHASSREKKQIVLKEMSNLITGETIASGATFAEVLHLNFSERSIRVEAALHDFSSMGFVQFALLLEGSDRASEDWTRTNAWEFTNLKAGRYRLQIGGLDSSGEPASHAIIHFVIHPPFYATIPAYIFYVALVVLASLGIVRLRTKRLLTLNRNLELAVLKRTEQVTAQSDQLRIQNEELNLAKQESDRLAVEARAAVESKSRFVANMSHEIRTPMNGVLGMCALLSETKLTAEQKELVSTIDNSGQNLLAVINDILHFSKVDSGSLVLECISLNLNELVGQILNLLSSAAADKGLELICDFDPNVPPYRFGDPVRIQQVLTNLVGNAIKFTQEGEIIVRVRRSEVSQDCVSISVIDTGIGISEENKKTLFKPFSQVDASITRRFGGTGLGLAISRKIVELMDGRIECESSEGEGSTFSFDICMEIDPTVEIPALESVYGKVFWFDASPGRRASISRNMEFYRIHCEMLDELTVLQNLQLYNDPARVLVVIDHALLEEVSSEFWKMVQSLKAKIDIFLLIPPGDNFSLLADESIDLNKIFKPLKFSSLIELLKGIRVPITTSLLEGQAETLDAETLANLNVLVVEDNRVNQRLATLSFGRLGIVPDICSDGLEAVEIVRSKDYHLILMDLQMPNMDGFEATQKIRELQVKGSFRSLIYSLTAGVAEFSEEKCLEANMDGYISKPVKIKDFKDVIHRTIETYDL